MRTYRFQRLANLSKSAAKSMILEMAFYGNGRQDESFTTEEQVCKFFVSHGTTIEYVINECRIWPRLVPLFENVFRGAVFPGAGARVSRVRLSDGKEDAIVDGPGFASKSYYWPQFASAWDSLQKAIDESSILAIHPAIVSLLSSIDSYIAYRVELWNNHHPESCLVDSKSKKVPFDDKIDSWIPQMSGGRRFDKSTRIWSAYRELRKVRDDEAIHLKGGALGASLSRLASIINLVPYGICRFLMELHRIFNEPIPAQIIRGAHAPDVEIIEVKE